MVNIQEAQTQASLVSVPHARAIAAGVGRKDAPTLATDSFLGHLPHMRTDPLAFLAKAFREQGDTVAISLIGKTLLVNHPDGVKRVLQTNQKNYRKTFFYRRMKRLVGEGLLTNEGPSWLRQRRLASPAFHRERLAALQSAMVRRTENMLATWETGSRDVSEEMVALTLAIAGDTLFSIDLHDDAAEVGQAAEEALRITNDRGLQVFLWPQAVPTPQNLAFAKAKRVLDGVVRKVIDERLAGESKDDLLQMFVDAEDADTGEKMSPQQLRDEVMTLLLAGHETTAHSLTWALYLLAQHPTIADQVTEEAERVFGDAAPRPEQLSELKLTQKVVKEAMRLYPAAWMIGREAIEDDEIDGFKVDAGTNIFVSPWLVHRHPGFWPHPEVFDPERFNEEEEKARHPMAYIPFAAGPRKCVGANFALMELTTILPMILKRFQLSVPVGLVVDPEPTITLRPRHGLPLELKAWPDVN